MPISILSGIIGIGGKILDKIIPDKTKAQDQEHEIKVKQIDATIEGERSRNYFTPRSVILYSMSFAVVYGIVIKPFASAFGIDLPHVDYEDALRLLLGLLGL